MEDDLARAVHTVRASVASRYAAYEQAPTSDTADELIEARLCYIYCPSLSCPSAGDQSGPCTSHCSAVQNSNEFVVDMVANQTIIDQLEAAARV